MSNYEYVYSTNNEYVYCYKYRIDIKNKEGVLHCLDRPAIECADGYKAWYRNGLLHRIGGPAVDDNKGDKLWYENGKLHRIDGPAIQTKYGTHRFFINDKELSEEQFNNYKHPKQMKVINDSNKSNDISLFNFEFLIHNLFSHPIAGIFWFFGCEKIGNIVHSFCAPY